jgi:tRNA modification GTPase
VVICTAMLEQHTICAVSTPPGEGGIGIIRISGGEALALAARVFRPRRRERFAAGRTHTMHYGFIVDPETGETVDEALVAVMRAPSTYTREDVVEFNCHGGMMPLKRTMELLLAAGAKQAEPGEFTKRAFLNGRIDLAQAEAVMDVIRARTDLAGRAAQELLSGGLSSKIADLRNMLVSLIAECEAEIEFSEEDVETGAASAPALKLKVIKGIIAAVNDLLADYRFGKIVRDGFATAIVGRPNVGKSSLLNALLRQDRAIVSDVPGTTRDVLEEYLNIDGIPLRILDTAGIRHSHDLVEREGVRRSRAAIASADLVLIVLDASQPLAADDRQVLEASKAKPAIAILNKSDLPRRLGPLSAPEAQVSLSCLSEAGLPDLRQALVEAIQNGVGPREHPLAVNQRQKTALERTRTGLEKAQAAFEAGLSPEFIALELREALDDLGLITGATHTEDILNRVFADFCIGK